MVEAQEFEYWRIGSILREGEFVGSVGFPYLLLEEFQSFPSKRRSLFYPWNPIYCVLRSFSLPQQQAPPQLPLINGAERIRNSWGKIYREGDSPILDKNCYFLEVWDRCTLLEQFLFRLWWMPYSFGYKMAPLTTEAVAFWEGGRGVGVINL